MWTWDEANNLFHPHHQAAAQYQLPEFISCCKLCAKTLMHPSPFTLGSNFILFPLSFHKNKSVSSTLFSLWSIYEEHLAERLQLKFSFCFHDST